VAFLGWKLKMAKVGGYQGEGVGTLGHFVGRLSIDRRESQLFGFPPKVEAHAYAKG